MLLVFIGAGIVRILFISYYPTDMIGGHDNVPR
jgi:hypothetical protein